MKIFFILCVFLSSAFSQETPTSAETAIGLDAGFEETFKIGIQSYGSQKYDEAAAAFTKALKLDPSNSTVLTNLALSQYQLGQKAFAVALLRRALSLDPDFSTARTAMEFILTQYEIRDVPHKIQYWENFRATFINPVPLFVYLLLTALLLFSTGWVLLTYFGERRRCLQNEKPFPAFSIVGFILSVGLFTSCSLTVLKIWDNNISRATVIRDSVSVLAAPDENAVSLFDLYGGLEVIALEIKENWIQVTYPGGLTGWVPKDSVFATSGKLKW